jgi:hypothetical protein
LTSKGGALKQQKDVLHVTLSDFHSGSNFALFLPRKWQGLKNNHFPTSLQIKIRKRFEKLAAEVKAARGGKRVRLVHDGDAIDGDHHHSGDVCTLNQMEQADIHIQLMAEFQKRIGWQAGDELYYTRGTQTHVEEYENYIGREMNAVANGDSFMWDLLRLKTNGVTAWFVHHGPGRGEGANEGNTMRNWLRNIYMEAVKDGRPVPDILYTGHVHNPTYSTYIWRREMEFRTMHGVILPSWQAKTVYAHMRAPVQVNKIGGVYQEIKADGTICIPRFCVMTTDDERISANQTEWEIA